MRNLILIIGIALTITSCMKDDYSFEEFENVITNDIAIHVPATTTTPTVEVTAVATPTIEVSRRDQIIAEYPSFDIEFTDYIDYWNLFVEIGELHGFDIAQEIVVIEDRTHGNTNLIAWARARNIEINLSKLDTHNATSLDELVWIGVNKELFDSKNNLTKTLVMFHEFGHDYFNQDHHNSGLMLPSTQGALTQEKVSNIFYNFFESQLN